MIVLEDFSRRCSCDGDIVVVNGFSSNTNLKSIVREIMETLHVKTRPSVPLSLLGQCRHIRSMFSDKIDGESTPTTNSGSCCLDHGSGMACPRVSMVPDHVVRGRDMVWPTDQVRSVNTTTAPTVPPRPEESKNVNSNVYVASREQRPLRRRNPAVSSAKVDQELCNIMWPKLRDQKGWTHSTGRNLEAWAYHLPGFPKKGDGDEGKTWFNGMNGMINFVRSKMPEFFNDAIQHRLQNPLPSSAAAHATSKAGVCVRSGLWNCGTPASEMKARRLYLFVHNIDGAALRSPATQFALSVLASAPRVHVIASIDHVNAPLMWGQALSDSFSWTWHNLATFDVYVQETTTAHITLGLHDNGNSTGATTHILRSLTPNHIRVLRILAENQLNVVAGTLGGLTFHDLYARCREEMLVNSDFTLRSLLTEFQDHELVTLHCAPGHSNMYVISQQALGALGPRQ